MRDAERKNRAMSKVDQKVGSAPPLKKWHERVVSQAERGARKSKKKKTFRWIGTGVSTNAGIQVKPKSSVREYCRVALQKRGLKGTIKNIVAQLLS